MKQKYSNKKIVIDNIVFASQLEGRYYKIYKELQKAGYISDLKWQQTFDLLPTQRDDKGKCIERKVTWTADFTFMERGQYVVVDSKGLRTQPYILRRKMMLFFHGIRIREVT